MKFLNRKYMIVVIQRPKRKRIRPSIRLKFLEERKLNNIIEMYKKDRPVLCNIIVKGKEILGIPYRKDKTKLFVKTGEERVEEIYLNDIEDIIIIKF